MEATTGKDIRARIAPYVYAISIVVGYLYGGWATRVRPPKSVLHKENFLEVWMSSPYANLAAGFAGLVWAPLWLLFRFRKLRRREAGLILLLPGGFRRSPRGFGDIIGEMNLAGYREAAQNLCMEASAYWSECPLISIDPEVVHGEPVFEGTRMPVEIAIDNYHAFIEMDGLSDEQAIAETLDCFPTIPSAEVLRCVIAFEAARETQLAS
jgi:uncharacterized protein (DUF433 family)